MCWCVELRVCDEEVDLFVVCGCVRIDFECVVNECILVGVVDRVLLVFGELVEFCLLF